MQKIDKIRNLLRVISKKHSFEIIVHCQAKPNNISELSNFLELSYMTVKTRVNELVEADILYSSSIVNPKTNKKNTSYKTKDFFISINPKIISELVLEKKIIKS